MKESFIFVSIISLFLGVCAIRDNGEGPVLIAPGYAYNNSFGRALWWIDASTGKALKSVDLSNSFSYSETALNYEDQIIYLHQFVTFEIGDSWIIQVNMTSGDILEDKILIKDPYFTLIGYDSQSKLLIGMGYGGLLNWNPIVVTIDPSIGEYDPIITFDDVATSVNAAWGYDQTSHILYQIILTYDWYLYEINTITQKVNTPQIAFKFCLYLQVDRFTDPSTPSLVSVCQQPVNSTWGLYRISMQDASAELLVDEALIPGDTQGGVFDNSSGLFYLFSGTYSSNMTISTIDLSARKIVNTFTPAAAIWAPQLIPGTKAKML